MKRKGFTLVELVMGLMILGLVSVTTLPIISQSFINFAKQRTRTEMVFICEMVMESLKAYSPSSSDDFLILNKPVREIIESFQPEGPSRLEILDENHRLVIEKDNKSDLVWHIVVRVYDLRGREKHVELEAYIPKI